MKSAQCAARGLTYLFVSHNLAVIAHMCERVAIMKAGAIVEQVPTAPPPPRWSTDGWRQRRISVFA